MIKIFDGKRLKGDYDLAGAFLSHSREFESNFIITLSIANQQKTFLSLEAKDEEQAQKYS